MSFLNQDISLENAMLNLKFGILTDKAHIEGKMYQNFYIGFSLCFIKSEKIISKHHKMFPVFHVKPKLEPK